jgi:hypothetical protein
MTLAMCKFKMKCKTMIWFLDTRKSEDDMAQIRRVSLLICDFYVYLVACIILGYLKELNPLKYTVYNI